MPPGGGASGGSPSGAPGGGTPGARPGSGGGWTGTPGSPGARTPNTPDASTGRPGPAPRRPSDAPEPVARGSQGAATQPGTQRPGGGNGPGNTRPGPEGPHRTPDGNTPRRDTTGTPHHDAPGAQHNNTPDQHSPRHDTPNHDNPRHGDPSDSHHGAPHQDPAHHNEPLTPDEVNQHHSESTPAGSSYHRGDADMGDLPHRVQPDPDGRFTADVHVTPDGHARIGDRLYTPEEFADVLRRNGDYDGRPIRLIGCDAGSNDFAHRLSRELDTEVMAPNKPAWTDSHGRVFSSDYEIGPDGRMRPRIPPDGEWSVHRPDGTSHHVGDDGFAPDTQRHDPHDVDADSSRHRGEDNADEPEDWRDRPGPDGRTPRENIEDPEYIKKHYYETTHNGVRELRIRHTAADPENPPHPLDLVDGKPTFKHDRPAAESLGFDEGRSSTHAPQRDQPSSSHDTDHEAGHTAETGGHDTPSAEGHVPGPHSDSRNWRDHDYDAIEDRIADREAKKAILDDTPTDDDGWKTAHNAKNDASEVLGEEASGHAVRDRLHREFSEAFPEDNFDVRPHPDAPEGSHRYQIVDADGNVRADITPRHPIDGEKPGPGNFDHIWEVDHHDGGEPHYIVHEAKGPGGGTSERYLPEVARTYKQGHPAYFDDIVKRMALTDPGLAHALERAKLEKRLDYIEVRALVDESVTPHRNLGYDYKPFNGYDYESPLRPPGSAPRSEE